MRGRNLYSNLITIICDSYMKNAIIFFIIFILLFSPLLSNITYANSFGTQFLSQDNNLIRILKGLVVLFLIERANNMFVDNNEDETIPGDLEDTFDKNTGNNRENISDKTIVIDPGHGGRDPGAVGPEGLQEKDVVLDIGLQLYDHLKRNTDAEVFLTRTDDYFVPLYERPTTADRVDADLFISIHINGSVIVEKNGIETYAFFDASRDNWAFAWHLQDSLVEELSLKDRGLKTDNFHVLRNTRNDMKSVLLEIGYITNPQEEQFLQKQYNRKRAARAIYEGLLAYYSQD